MTTKTVANFRQIHVHCWKDQWFGELEPEEKLLFIYLFSNSQTSMSGLYKLPFRVIVFETGLQPAFVDETMTKFETAGKVFYNRDLGVVWVVNMRRYHASDSPKVTTRIERDVEDIPDCDVKKRYLSSIIGYRYGIDTESYKDKDKDKNKNKTPPASRGGLRSQPPKNNGAGTGKISISPTTATPIIKPDHPALVAYREEVRLHVPVTLRENVIAAIGDRPDDVNRWRDNIHQWIARGYNPRNIAGLIDAFKYGLAGATQAGRPRAGIIDEEIRKLEADHGG